MSVKEIKSIPIKLSEKNLYKNLQNGKSNKISNRTKVQIQKAIQEVLEHVNAKGIYRIFPLPNGSGRNDLKNNIDFSSKNLEGMFHDCKGVAVFLTTIGKDVDEVIKQAMDKRPHYGYLLNLAAAAAAEEAAEYMQQYIKETLPEDQTTTYRYSPGYCDWPLTEQKKLCEMIPFDKIGVKLSETYLMSPHKSVSGIFGICPANSNLKQTNLCQKCTRKKCPHRRI